MRDEDESAFAAMRAGVRDSVVKGADTEDVAARGMTNSNIARTLVVSPKTVRNHVSNVFTKVQVTDRSEAIIRARNAGLGSN